MVLNLLIAKGRYCIILTLINGRQVSVVVQAAVEKDMKFARWSASEAEDCTRRLAMSVDGTNVYTA